MHADLSLAAVVLERGPPLARLALIHRVLFSAPLDLGHLLDSLLFVLARDVGSDHGERLAESEGG